MTTIINHKLCLLINIGATATYLPVTKMVFWKGLEDSPSRSLGRNHIVELIRNPCAVLLKQAMEGLLFLDQLIGQNHTAKLVFLVNGNLQEVTATGDFRTGLLIHAGAILLEQGAILMELLILKLGVCIETGNSAVIRDEHHTGELMVEEEEGLHIMSDHIMRDHIMTEELGEVGVNRPITIRWKNLIVRRRMPVLKLHPMTCQFLSIEG